MKFSQFVQCVDNQLKLFIYFLFISRWRSRGKNGLYYNEISLSTNNFQYYTNKSPWVNNEVKKGEMEAKVVSLQHINDEIMIYVIESDDDVIMSWFMIDHFPCLSPKSYLYLIFKYS